MSALEPQEERSIDPTAPAGHTAPIGMLAEARAGWPQGEPPGSADNALDEPSAAPFAPPDGASSGMDGASGTTDSTDSWAFVTFMALIGAVVVAVNFWAPIKQFLLTWGWLVGLVLATVVLVLLLPIGRRWLARLSPATQAALLSFVGVPLVLTGVGSVVMLPDPYRVTVLRCVFLLVVCSLPAVMWYLFIATRKASLLNDFLSSLFRLGLLDRAANESETSRERRIHSYLQRFEATYGDLPPEMYQAAIEDRLATYKKSDLAGASATSSASAPVLMATVLIALGWFVTLPPTGVPGSDWVGALTPSASPVSMAFLGAYFFSLQFIFRRSVQRDLRGSAYAAVAIRIVVSVIGICVLVTIDDVFGFSPAGLLLAGFVLGVFPRVLWQILDSVFRRMVGRFALPSMRSDLPISDLDGLTVWHEARLEEEDVENLPNMARSTSSRSCSTRASRGSGSSTGSTRPSCSPSSDPRSRGGARPRRTASDVRCATWACGRARRSWRFTRTGRAALPCSTGHSDVPARAVGSLSPSPRTPTCTWSRPGTAGP
jgi:hypothetical protein